MKRCLMSVTALYLLICAGCTDETQQGSAPECTRNGVCDDGVFCNGEERCQDGKCTNGAAVDCDDQLSCTIDSCDETKWACRHDPPDADSDGHADASCKDSRSRPLGDDCDDSDASRYPGAKEFCDPNQVDEDCDLSTVGEKDDDGDGLTSVSCCNASARERQCGSDCDDTNSRVSPEASESCDGVDNDCDGRVDEDVELLLFRDADADGYGAGDVALRSCTKVRGYSTEDGDCDDSEPTIHPGAPESCAVPAVDRDCSGTKNDLPGGCACKTGSERPCPLAGLCSAGVLACADRVWASTCSIPPVPEACNGLDDDCDGQVDEGVTVDCYEDTDGDGYAAAGSEHKNFCPTDEQAQGCPQGFTQRAPSGGAIDCAPKDGDVSPQTAELCNGKDDNCDGSVDEGLALTQRFIDSDGDGHPGTAVQRCAKDPTSASSADDCMDDNPLVYPGQDGVFSSPACRHGFVPCRSNTTTWRCKPAGSDACGGDLMAAHWDYDCDGAVAGEPFVSDPCLTTSTCGAGCGPSGFLATSSGAPSCGSTQAYQICRCLGAQGGGCTGMTEQHPYPCH